MFSGSGLGGGYFRGPDSEVWSFDALPVFAGVGGSLARDHLPQATNFLANVARISARISREFLREFPRELLREFSRDPARAGARKSARISARFFFTTKIKA